MGPPDISTAGEVLGFLSPFQPWAGAPLGQSLWDYMTKMMGLSITPLREN